MNEIIKLKLENERLKKEINDLKFYIDAYQIVWGIHEHKKCKDALQEIKEIAETHTELCKDCDNQREDLECQELCNGYKLKQILQIINKTEDLT